MRRLLSPCVPHADRAPHLPSISALIPYLWLGTCFVLGISRGIPFFMSFGSCSPHASGLPQLVRLPHVKGFSLYVFRKLLAACVRAAAIGETSTC